MRRIFLSLFFGQLALLILTLPCSAQLEKRWVEVTSGRMGVGLESLAAEPKDSQAVYVGSSKGGVFRSLDGGRSWQQVLSVRGIKREVNFLAIEPEKTNCVYAATENGLFFSETRGSDWRKIFEGTGEDEKNCLSVAVSRGKLYLGTKAGLFISSDKGKTWNEASGEVGNKEIQAIAIHPSKPEVVYLATTNGVFKSEDEGRSWRRIYVSSLEEAQEADEDEEIEEVEELEGPKLRHIAIDPLNPQRIFLATSEGVVYSGDAGAFWQGFPRAGLASEDIRFILASCQDRQIYVATGGGVFEFSQESWRELYNGITSKDIRFLALDSQNSLWAAAKDGVFKMVEAKSAERTDKEKEGILDHFGHEPTIQEVQREAIYYAEVQPEKIKSWRKGARFRSLLPDFSLGYNKSVSRYGTEWYVGPRDWNVDLTWDLADLIWNPYQKDIDVRSRLMVQLRDDILDEVTRLYFERRRLQTELILFPPADLKEKLEKELRLQELTASIDALTGGYLSKNLKNDNN